MKSAIILALFSIAFMFSVNSLAKCKNVYSIGAYDEAFKSHIAVTKLGPLPASEIPPTLPKSFLEKDGSYGGGEAFCTIEKACHALKRQLNSKVLPETETWHIYILDADWNQDTYKLYSNDYRINRSVKVLNLVREEC